MEVSVTVQQIECYKKGETPDGRKVRTKQLTEQAENVLKSIGISFQTDSDVVRKVNVLQMMEQEKFKSFYADEPDEANFAFSGAPENSGFLFIERSKTAVLTAREVKPSGAVAKASRDSDRTRSLVSNMTTFKLGEQYHLDAVVDVPDELGGTDNRVMVGFLTGFAVLIQFDGTATYNFAREQVFQQVNAYRIDGIFANDLNVTFKTLRTWQRKDTEPVYPLRSASSEMKNIYPLDGNEDLLARWNETTEGGADLLPDQDMTLACSATDLAVSELLISSLDQHKINAEWVTSVQDLRAVDAKVIVDFLSSAKSFAIKEESGVPWHLLPIGDDGGKAIWKTLYDRLTRPLETNFDSYVEESDALLKRNRKRPARDSPAEAASAVAAEIRDRNARTQNDDSDYDSDAVPLLKKKKRATARKTPKTKQMFGTLTDAAVYQKLYNAAFRPDDKWNAALLEHALKELSKTGFVLGNGTYERKVMGCLKRARLACFDTFTPELEELYKKLGYPVQGPRTATGTDDPPPDQEEQELSQGGDGEAMPALIAAKTTKRAAGEAELLDRALRDQLPPASAGQNTGQNTEAMINLLSTQVSVTNSILTNTNALQSSLKSLDDKVTALKSPSVGDAVQSTGANIVLPTELANKIDNALDRSQELADLREKITLLERRSTVLSQYMPFAVDTGAKGLSMVLYLKPHVANGTFTLEEAKTIVKNCIQIQGDGQTPEKLADMLGTSP